MTVHERASAGGCLCGAVRYEVRGPLRAVIACHCRQCQRSSGHFVAATAARRRDLHLSGEENLSWYRSSARAERAFCRRCGSNLFWRRRDDETVSIMAGTLDRPTGLRLSEHIFTESAGDYYEITDGLPRRPGGLQGAPRHPVGGGDERGDG